MLLPNSESEYRVFSTDYNLECPYRIIPNGVDKAAVTEHYQTADNYRNAIICMARIEPLKNQLGLIRALNKTGIRVFIHGKASPNHHQYYNQCQHEAAENIQILPWLETSQLYPIYATARVHVLPSFFETTGLSTLEAAALGCNVVITDRGYTRDYFGDDAWYCEPEDPASIRSAITAAYEAPYNEAFRKRILEQYTWDRAAEETLKAYEFVLQQAAGKP
jgi:glycosyltransferase involved in cell wall biosynthesis